MSAALRIALAVLQAAAALAGGSAQAQDYPARLVRIVAPSAPGGGFDLPGHIPSLSWQASPKSTF
jgi:tripartite-type tricarboxylate transporter receptor subunit TctC